MNTRSRCVGKPCFAVSSTRWHTSCMPSMMARNRPKFISNGLWVASHWALDIRNARGLLAAMALMMRKDMLPRPQLSCRPSREPGNVHVVVRKGCRSWFHDILERFVFVWLFFR